MFDAAEYHLFGVHSHTAQVVVEPLARYERFGFLPDVAAAGLDEPRAALGAQWANPSYSLIVNSGPTLAAPMPHSG